MHSNNNIKVLVFSSDHFTNSFVELKGHFNFNFDFFKEDKKVNTYSNYGVYVIEDLILNDKKILKFLKETNIPKLIIYKSDTFSDLKFDDKILKPLNIHDLNEKIIDLATKKQFRKNSFIKLKEYILDKNEKKLKKKDLFIILTEKEIQLLELLFKEKKPIKKINILKEVWKYSDAADTHTVETHIYRLRKKIFNQFKDQNFINNSKSGYSL